ncbi:hypothetical protein C8Q80DRAFT_1264501 [Daedaleopsis nitida]|nr:hypothetical protein C8Q80DRAFT_1264501 [Daedaleopsis nitida]
MATPRRTLEELHLLKCSLLPGELLAFTEDAAQWTSLLDSYALDPDCELPDSEAQAAPHFQVKLEGSSDVFFDVELPYDYSEGGADVHVRGLPRVAVRGDCLGRDEQERWQRAVSDALRDAQVQDSEYPSYELISTHLLPQLHASLDSRPSPATTRSTSTSAGTNYESLRAAQANVDATGRTSGPNRSSSRYHALFVSHHLKSPQKRRSISQWSHELALSGFAKVGYPGVIYCEGAQEDVEDFVDRVKSMQWLALRLRFIEPAPAVSSSAERVQGVQGKGGARREWAEFEKVGEVVEEMRRLDREKFIVEMGIGSAGNPSTTSSK